MTPSRTLRPAVLCINNSFYRFFVVFIMYIPLKFSKKFIRILTVSAFVTCMLLIPWEDFGGDRFRDKEVYINYFTYGTSVLEYKSFYGFLDYLVNEFFWHLLVSSIAGMGLPAEAFFLIITGMCLYVFSWYLVSRHGLMSLAFLINPLVVDFAFSQFRLALAISLAGIAYILGRRSVSYILVGLSLFIHTAMLLFLFMYFAIYFLRHLPRDKMILFQFLVLVCVGALVSLAISPWREAILSVVGDRRAEYGDASSTLLYSSFWILFLIASAVRMKSSISRDSQRFSVIILSVVSFNVLTGGYSLRFLSAGFPALVSSILDVRGYYGLLLVSCFVIYIFFQWLYWFRVI